MRNYTAIDFPLRLFECKMQAFGLQTIGYAVDSDNEAALIKSFAEAWERIWFSKLVKQEHGPKNSNGFAAGSTNEMALENAEQELIERAMLLKAWQTQVGWNKTSLSSFKLKMIQFALWLKGWRLQVFDLNSNLGQVKCFFASHSDRGLIFDSCFVKTRKESEIKGVYSILKCIALPKITKMDELPAKAKPVDHARFYANPGNLKAIEFLNLQIKKDTTIELENPELINQKLLHEAGEFPAVALCQHPTWPKLSWGTNSIQGANPWPHPLA